MQYSTDYILSKRIGVQESVELIVTDSRNGVLLEWRDDEYFHGWHIPGTQREQRSTIEEDIERCATREMGTKVKVMEFLAHVDHVKSAPFHQAALLYHCKLLGEPHQRLIRNETPKPGDLKWFINCPHEMIPDQITYWQYIVPLIS